MTHPALIPFDDFGGQGPLLHFAHANGYPPSAYRKMLSDLSTHFHVTAMHLRPLWSGSNPQEIEDWRPLSDDISRFFQERDFPPLFACGHSLGATSTLRLAIDKPAHFKALVLIDPVLFPPLMTIFSNLLYQSGLSYQLNPMARVACKRKVIFRDRAEMFEIYRKKHVFRKISDKSLGAYIDSLCCEQDGGYVSLCYSAAWEARIYVTGSRADQDIWNRLSTLKMPLMVIRGGDSNAFGKWSASLFKKRLPTAKMVTIPYSTHLAPLEYPEIVVEAMIDFFAETTER